MIETVSEELQELINKRLSLNLLIQGCAQHAFLTAHYLAEPQLQQIDPELIELYDRLAIGGVLTNWYGMNVFSSGRPGVLWKKIRKNKHPLALHPILYRHGEVLADHTRIHAVRRAGEKGMWHWPVLLSFGIIKIITRLENKESSSRHTLEELAKEVTASIWGIDPERLDGKLTREVAFGSLRPSKTAREQLLRASAAGYGGVMRERGELRVVAKAFFWPLLVHELVKGTAELICLHGMNHLERDMWLQVCDYADHIEYESCMLMAGAELWRRFLAVAPSEPDHAHILMHMAMLSADRLETVIVAIIEDPDWARELLAGLGE